MRKLTQSLQKEEQETIKALKQSLTKNLRDEKNKLQAKT